MSDGSAIGDTYVARTPRSAERNAEANRWMPGGDTRSTAWFPPYPPFASEGAGAHDFSWTAVVVDMLARREGEA